MWISIPVVALYMIILIILICYVLNIRMTYKNMQIIIREYENIVHGYDELQEGIGKYRESTHSHYYVGAAGNRNAANTYRK